MLKTRFIDTFEVLLLDMGRTFMFDVDRFNESDKLGETYQKAGGSMLSDEEVYRIASSIFNQMIEDSQKPENFDCFASVAKYIDKYPASCCLPDSEKELMEKVIAEHEIGVVPESYATILTGLS
jgi:hypothetical protein